MRTLAKLSVIDRFLDKIAFCHSGCWEWVGSIGSNGYGNFRDEDSKMVSVHRFSYEFFNGRTIPAGMTVDHICGNRSCVNPDHLEVVTSRENTMRGNTLATINSKATHCPQGHPYSEENTCYSQGRRKCRACHRLAMRKSRLVSKFAT